jgi:hypothetical protein
VTPIIKPRIAISDFSQIQFEGSLKRPLASMHSRTFASKCPTVQVKLGRRVAATATPAEKRITNESVQFVGPSEWMGRKESRRAIAIATRPIGTAMNQTSAASPGGRGQLCVQTRSSQEATRKAPLVTIRQPAVVYPAMRPGFEIGSGGGHRSRRRAFRLALPGSMGERSSPILRNGEHFPRQWYSLPSIRPIWVVYPFVRYRASSRRLSSAGRAPSSSSSTSTSRGPCWSAWRASPSGRVGGAFYFE